MRQTAGMGGDVSHAARGLVQGFILSARELGMDAKQAASSVAQAALEEADDIGSAVASAVRHTLKESIDGIKVALHEPARHKSKR